MPWCSPGVSGTKAVGNHSARRCFYQRSSINRLGLLIWRIVHCRVENMTNESLHTLHKTYIRGTEPKAIVEYKKVFLCYLTAAVHKGGDFSTRNIYITTKVLKHMYDKKPAEEYDFLLVHLPQIIKYPDRIYQNRNGKRGNICLSKIVKNQPYLCSLEDKAENKEIVVVTAYRIRDKKYLEKYSLVWSWRDDVPSS